MSRDFVRNVEGGFSDLRQRRTHSDAEENPVFDGAREVFPTFLERSMSGGVWSAFYSLRAVWPHRRSAGYGFVPAIPSPTVGMSGATDAMSLGTSTVTARQIPPRSTES